MMEDMMLILEIVCVCILGGVLSLLAIAQRIVRIVDKKKDAKVRTHSKQSTAALIVPSKGMHSSWEETWSGYLNQTYPSMQIYVSFENESDPGFLNLSKRCHRNDNLHLFIAGSSSCGSQQNHNMNFAVSHALKDAPGVLLFGDNDIIPSSDWADQLIRHLQADEKVKVVSASRYFPIQSITFGSLGMAYFLSLTQQFAILPRLVLKNVFWGGSFAMRREDFEAWNVHTIWERGISDDMGLGLFLKNNGYHALHLHSLLVPEVLPQTCHPCRWYSRQLLNLKAHEFLSWSLVGIAGYGLHAAIFVLSIVNFSLSTKFYALLPLGFYFLLVMINTAIGSFMYSFKHRILLTITSPFYHFLGGVAYAMTLFRYSLNWSGRRYYFNRKGFVVRSEKI